MIVPLGSKQLTEVGSHDFANSLSQFGVLHKGI